MAGVERRHGFDHFKRTVCAVSAHGKTIHIVRQRAFANVNVASRIRKGLDPDRANDGIRSVFDLTSNVRALPFVPVRNMRKLGFSALCAQNAQLVHLPALSAGGAEELRTARTHLVFRLAVGALIQNLVQTFCTAGAGDANAALALPKSEMPHLQRHTHAPEGTQSAVELLKVLLRLTSEKHGVASKVIANSDDLEKIAAEGEKAEVEAKYAENNQ